MPGPRRIADTQTLKAQVIISGVKEQLASLSQDDWNNQVTEGSANQFKKELVKLSTVFQSRADDDMARLLNDLDMMYSALLPFLNAFRLHRGNLQDFQLAELSTNLHSLLQAMVKHTSETRFCPQLQLFYIQGCFLRQMKCGESGSAFQALSRIEIADIVHQQKAYFKDGMTSEEVARLVFAFCTHRIACVTTSRHLTHTVY